MKVRVNEETKTLDSFDNAGVIAGDMLYYWGTFHIVNIEQEIAERLDKTDLVSKRELESLKFAQLNQ